MIDKKLLGIVPGSKKYIAGNIIAQWVALCANIVMMFAITDLLQKLFDKTWTARDFLLTAVVAALAVAIRFIGTTVSAKMSYLSSKEVKKILREKIFNKLLRLGPGYRETTNTAEIVQLAVEGVDQLDTYFGAYIPQFFYAFIAPLTLFIVLSFVNFLSAVILLVIVPLIPGTIMMVQKWAKKLLSKYWGQYTALGDNFLENLQGLTTLKIYQSDKFKNDEMNVEAESFRKITMRVLIMQLNSVSIMDLIAYGGAALGVIISVSQFARDNVNLAGCLLIILLAADYFIPMRQLGSFFHIAMNGMAASKKIFALLALDEPAEKTALVPQVCDIAIRDLSYAYTEDKDVLRGVNLDIPQGGFTAIVGESGCGKSTLAGILTGANVGYRGSVTVGGAQLSELNAESLAENLTYIGHGSYLFKGTVRDNLLMGKPDATDDALWVALEKADLADFLRGEHGLDTQLQEKAANLSGGQRQRLALARALLHDSRIYIFDEATSNVDMESEAAIMAQILALAKTKTVVLISHRLANVAQADNILVLDKGAAVEQGTHARLLEQNGVYAALWNTQQTLETYLKGGDGA